MSDRLTARGKARTPHCEGSPFPARRQFQVSSSKFKVTACRSPPKAGCLPLVTWNFEPGTLNCLSPPPGMQIPCHSRAPAQHPSKMLHRLRGRSRSPQGRREAIRGRFGSNRGVSEVKKGQFCGFGAPKRPKNPFGARQTRFEPRKNTPFSGVSAKIIFWNLSGSAGRPRQGG